MKSSVLLQVFCFLCLFILVPGCTKEDDVLLQEEFLSTLIDGEEFAVSKSNGIMVCEKQLTNYGTINLSVNVTSSEGKKIEFLIHNYQGKRSYNIGARTISPNGNFAGSNWLNYTEGIPQSIWSSFSNNYAQENPLNNIEITNDNGSYISGHFTSTNYQNSGSLAKILSNGNFHLRLNNR